MIARLALWGAMSLLVSPMVSWSQSVALEATPQRTNLSPQHAFTWSEIHQFTKDVEVAERIDDPMDRCLHYPNPPGSHWSPVVVKAFCSYRLQPMITFDEIRKLVDAGKAIEIDRQLSAWKKDTTRHPEMMWRFLNQNFGTAAPEKRAVLEAWKQQSPDSVYAHLASGFSYLNEAWSARGGAYAADTSQFKFDEMNRILPRAEGDLRVAARLDGHQAIAQAVMIKAGMLVSDATMVHDAIVQGLHADPNSMPLFNGLSMVAEPRWGGSAESQQQLLLLIDKQGAQNPLILTVRATVLVDQSDLLNCDCRLPEQQALYRNAFDEVGVTSDLLHAAKNALSDGQNDLAYVYLSEVLRFNPDDQSALDARHQAREGMSATLFGP